MKVKELQDGLKKVAKGSASGMTLPVLANVLVESQLGRVRLVTTDLESFHIVDIHFPGKGFGNWAVTVPMRALQRVVKALPKDTDVSLSTDGESLCMKDDAGMNLELKGITAEEFPRIVEFEAAGDIALDAAELRRALALTLPFTNKDEYARPVMTTVRLEVRQDGLHFVSADNFRMGIYHIERYDLKCGDAEFNIPVKAMGSFIQQLDKRVELVVLRYDAGKELIGLSGGTFRVVVRCVEGRYPQYKQIIPEVRVASIELNCKELTDVLTRASVIAQDAARLVTWTLTGRGLTVSAKSSYVGAFQQTISTDVQFTDDKMENFEINLNYGYLLDLLRAIKKAKGPDTIIFEPNSPTGSALFRLPGVSYKHIIMPMHKPR